MKATNGPCVKNNTKDEFIPTIPSESLPQKPTIQDTKTLSPTMQFKLPIEYLEKKYIHELPHSVSADLELIKTTGDKGSPMYNILFRPKNDFEKHTMNTWSHKYTSNVDFLTDTQQVIAEMGNYRTQMEGSKKYIMDCDAMVEIWKSIKEDSLFLEKYSYMEWDMLKHLNSSSSFL